MTDKEAQTLKHNRDVFEQEVTRLEFEIKSIELKEAQTLAQIAQFQHSIEGYKFNKGLLKKELDQILLKLKNVQDKMKKIIV